MINIYKTCFLLHTFVIYGRLSRVQRMTSMGQKRATIYNRVYKYLGNITKAEYDNDIM